MKSYQDVSWTHCSGVCEETWARDVDLGAMRTAGIRGHEMTAGVSMEREEKRTKG